MVILSSSFKRVCALKGRVSAISAGILPKNEITSKKGF